MKRGAWPLALLLLAPLAAESRMLCGTAPGDARCAIARAAGSLDLRLPRLFDEGLRQEAAMALSRGARVRVVANPNDKAARGAASGLRKLGIELRWSGKAGACFAVLDSAQLLLGDFDRSPESPEAGGASICALDGRELAGVFTREFEREWSGLSEKLPRSIALKDELEALPDPRDTEPRLKTRRRNN